MREQFPFRSRVPRARGRACPHVHACRNVRLDRSRVSEFNERASAVKTALRFGPSIHCISPWAALNLFAREFSIDPISKPRSIDRSLARSLVRSRDGIKVRNLPRVPQKPMLRPFSTTFPPRTADNDSVSQYEERLHHISQM